MSRPSIRRHSASGLPSAIALGKQRLRHVLIADRPEEALDGAGADRRRPRIGGGRRRPAVDHRVADLDPGGPAVEQDAPDLQLQQWEQFGGLRVIGLVGVQCRGELAFEIGCHRDHFGLVDTSHDQAGRAEHFRLQGFRVAEGRRVGAEQRGPARRPVVAGRSADDEVRVSVDGGDPLRVARGDVRGQHGRGLRLRQRITGAGEERIESRPVHGDDQTGVRAELARPHRQRSDKGPAKVGPSGGERTVQQEHRVDGAHLGVDGDRLWTGCGGSDQSHSTGT